MKTQNTTYYDLLGILPTASEEEIKKAYRAASLKSHPDKNQGAPIAEDHFKLIKRAYDVLIDPETRKLYDLEVGITERPAKVVKERVPVYIGKNDNSDFWKGLGVGFGIMLLLILIIFGGGSSGSSQS